MATIKNKKRAPLSQDEVVSLCKPDGVRIFDCDDGICLIAKWRPGHRTASLMFDHGAQSDERWWADLSSSLKGKFLSKNPSGSEREKLENKVNAEFFGLEPSFTLFF